MARSICREVESEEDDNFNNFSEQDDNFSGSEGSEHLNSDVDVFPQEVKLKETKCIEEHRFTFNSTHDLLLLRQIHHERPFSAEYGQLTLKWSQISLTLNKCFGMQTSWKSCRDRFDNLLKRHNKGELASLKASGTKESYEEKKQLLTDISAMVEEFKMQKTAKQSKKSDQRREAEKMLTDAIDVLKNNEATKPTNSQTTPLKKPRLTSKMEESMFLEAFNQQVLLHKEEMELKKKMHEDEKEERRKQLEIQQNQTMALIRQMEMQREKDAAFFALIQKFLEK